MSESKHIHPDLYALVIWRRAALMEDIIAIDEFYDFELFFSCAILNST
jgi:hypothetical protein